VTTQRQRSLRVGLFAIAAIALLAVALIGLFGKRLFADGERAVMHFEGSVYGLQVGAPVVFRGVRLGSVVSIGVVDEGSSFAIPVVAEIDRLAIRSAAGAGGAPIAIAKLVERGLIAQLATQSLLTGQLYVDLDLRSGVTARTRKVGDLTEIPTRPAKLAALQSQLENLDIAKLASDVAAVASSARGFLQGPELRGAVAELAQAAAAVKQFAAALDRRSAPVGEAAVAALREAGSAAQRAAAAADRLGEAGQRFGAAGERLGAAAARTEALLAPGSPLLTHLQRASEDLARGAAALRQAAAEDSALVQGSQQALADVSRAARQVRELAELLERHPDALIRGRTP
jgi:paraquat-inducible protein B